MLQRKRIEFHDSPTIELAYSKPLRLLGATIILEPQPLMRGNWTSVGKHVFREADTPIIYGNLSVQLYDNQIAKPRNPNRPGGITARMPPPPPLA